MITSLEKPRSKFLFETCPRRGNPQKGRKRNSSTLPVQWLAASRTIRVDSGIEADKLTRYDIVRDKDITRCHVRSCCTIHKDVFTVH